MFPLTLMYKWGAIALAVALAAAAGIWYINKVEQRGYDRAVGEYSIAALKVTDEARAKEHLLQLKVQEAQDAATKREQMLRADARNLRGELSRLQNELAAATHDLPEDTSDAVRARVAALHIILNQCTKEYSELAETADRINSDRQTLIEAWPK